MHVLQKSAGPPSLRSARRSLGYSKVAHRLQGILCLLPIWALWAQAPWHQVGARSMEPCPPEGSVQAHSPISRRPPAMGVCRSLLVGRATLLANSSQPWSSKRATKPCHTPGSSPKTPAPLYGSSSLPTPASSGLSPTSGSAQAPLGWSSSSLPPQALHSPPRLPALGLASAAF